MDKYKNNIKKKSRSRSRDSYDKNKKYSSYKYRQYSSKSKNRQNRENRSYSQSDNSLGKSQKSKKNISSYIIKKDSAQEEEIERENDKRQTELYNEYLQLKREREENGKINKLPALISRDKDDSYDYEENEEDEQKYENYKGPYRGRVYGRPSPPPRRRIRMIGGYRRNSKGIKRRGGFMTKFRGRKIRKIFY